MGIMDWAQLAQQQNPSGFPVYGDGLQPTQAPYWQGNQLQIPGLGALLSVGVNGAGWNGGGAGGGSGTGGTGGTGTIGGGTGGGGTGQINVGGAGGANLNQGTLNAQYYYDRNPDVLQAYNALTQADRDYLEGVGYAPTYNGFAQYHWDVYGSKSPFIMPDWALQGLSGPPQDANNSPVGNATTQAISPLVVNSPVGTNLGGATGSFSGIGSILL